MEDAGVDRGGVSVYHILPDVIERTSGSDLEDRGKF